LSGRRIYVDIDDVLSKTIEGLIDLLEETHHRRVEVEEVRHFDLGKSFGLADHEVHEFMDRAHSDEVIELIAPAEGAAAILEGWASAGHEVRLVTGRPPSTHSASLRWLERHGVTHTLLHHLDKWNRPRWNEEGLPALRFDEIPQIGFDLAVEDSLETAVRLVEDFEIPVALIDRPWNRDLSEVSSKAREGLYRCNDWDVVARVSAEVLGSDFRRG
jgi:uncharacterized HAD superfamily protein